MRGRAAVALAALVASGCSLLSPTPDPGPNQGPWAEARDAATRTQKVYDVLDDVAFATATWQSPAVRAARVERLAEWKGLAPAEREAMLASERAAAESGEEFLLAFFTAVRSANDLSRPGSTWDVSLRVEGGAPVAPAKVEWVRADATLRMLYPYVTDFDTLYRIRFPRVPGAPLATRPFQVRIASALGKIELSWAP